MSYNLNSAELCRLCAEPSSEGINLKATDEDGRSNYDLINKYLPLKIEDDETLPRTICPSCHLQLRNIVCFFGLLIKGQTLLRKYCKQITSEESIDGGELRYIKYGDDSEIQREINIMVEKTPKRRRGRPRKGEVVESARKATVDVPAVTADDAGLSEIQAMSLEEKEALESPPDGKRRRKRPLRYSGAILGKELEKVFHENGVIDDSRVTEEEDTGGQEVIGQVQNNKGESMGVVEWCNKLLDNLRRKIQFRCDTCQAVFTQESKFVDHAATHYPVQLQCSQCDDSFPSSTELQTHCDTTGHISVDPLSSSKEPAQTDSTATFAPPPEPLSKSTCPLCQKVFKYASTLRKHMRSAHDDVVGCFPCDICGKKLKYPSSVQYHKEAEHSTNRKFVCSKCNMAFRHRRLLQKHQQVHATDTGVNRPELTCPECGKYFKSKANLNVHIQIHGSGKKYICQVCAQPFQHKHALVLHMRLHSGEKPFQCYFCNKTFAQKGNLHEHMRTHTGERPFICEICGRAFTTSSQRRLHLKRHIGEKPFECEICQKSFLHKDSLTTHMRRHTGEKPYQCRRCDKTFSELSAVKKHVRIHTGEKPFMCNVCGKSFSDKSNLGKHKKTHKDVEDGDILITDILPEGLTMSDLALVDSSNDKQFWTLVKQSTDTLDDRDSDTQQVVYITYNDPDDPNSKVSEALLLTKDGVVEKDMDEFDLDVKGGGSIESQRLITTSTDEVNTNCPSPSNQLAPGVTPLEGQVVMDEHGNPLRFTTADGGIFQVTTIDGESLQLTSSDGTSMPVRITTADGENLTPAGLDISTMVGDVTDDTLVSAAVESLELVSGADVRLLSEAALDFLPLG